MIAIDEAFASPRYGRVRWPDPHADDSPLDDEYSRVTNPARYRILGARLDAWTASLERFGFAVAEPASDIAWPTPGPIATTTRLIKPSRPGALPLWVGRSGIGDTADVGVTLGVGDPVVCLGWFPHCGCDACDSGSQYELDTLDEHLLSVVSGTFRRLQRRDMVITVLYRHGWSASGSFRPGEVEAILEKPTGWSELTAPSWLTV